MGLKLIVSGRNEGKTTALIAWLLRGHPIDNYPGWSRVIVCCTTREVVRVTDEVRRATEQGYDTTDGRCGIGTYSTNERALADLRKAVWGYADLHHNMVGASRDFEYAIDNLDLVMFSGDISWVTRPPAFATITATVFTPQEVIDHD